MANIKDMIKQAEAWESNEANHIAFTHELEYGDDKSATPDWVWQKPIGFVEGFENMPFNEHAAVQLAQMYRLPSSAKMTRVMFNKAPGTFGGLLNHLNDQKGHGLNDDKPKGLLFRTIGRHGEEYPLDNQVRAVMGKDWNPHLNSVALRMIDEWAESIKRFGKDAEFADRLTAIRGANVTITDPNNPLVISRVNTFSPDAMNLLISTNITVEIDGDTIIPAMWFRINQIMKLATVTGPATFREICSNGARILVAGYADEDVVFNPRITHRVGGEAFKVAFMNAMMNNLPYSAKAIEEAALAQRIALYQENEMMDKLFEKLLPEDKRHAAAVAAGRGDSINGTPNTLGHLTNTMTYIANQVEGLSAGTREALEVFGGTANRDIVAMVQRRSDVREIDVAAHLFSLANIKLDEEEEDDELIAIPQGFAFA